MLEKKNKITKLQLQACSDPDCKKPDSSLKYEVQLNPAQISFNYSGGLVNEKKTDKLATGEIFDQADVDFVKPTYNLELLIDNTGVIPLPLVKMPILKQVKLLKDICTGYNGDIHGLSFIKVSWGSLSINTQCKGFSANFLKFKADGAPIRAKVNMSFKVYNDPFKEQKLKGRQSPDLTKVILVKAGDTLPRLCYKYYGDFKYYPLVAKYNGLSNMIYLKPGQQVIFPPLV